MGLRKYLSGIFDSQKFKDHDSRVGKIETMTVSILAILQAGLVASPLTWWIQDSGSISEEIFSLQLMVKGSQLWEFKAYGAEVIFDPAILILEGVDLGDLNSDWTMEGENEIEPGRWRFGAIPGTANPIIGERTGCVSVFRFAVIGEFAGQAEIRLENAVDDFKVLSPQPLIFNLIIE